MDVDEDVKENKENEDGMVNGLDNDDTVTFVQNGDAMDEDEIDPLDAFMNTMVIPEVTKLTTEVSVLDEKSSDDKVKENGRKKTAGRSLDRIIPGEDSGLEYPNLDNDEDPLEDEDDDVLVSGSFGLPPTSASPVTKTAANES